MHRPLRVLLAALALSAAGCSGTPASLAALAERTPPPIEPGVTTRAEVEAELGPPTDAAPGPDGTTVVTWRYAAPPTEVDPGEAPRPRGLASPAPHRTLRVTFDARGVAVAEALEGEEVRRGVPGDSSYRAAPPTP